MISDDGNRTLFFDFMPSELGTALGFKTRFYLYTLPGKVLYDASRMLILKGVDGVVFVEKRHFGYRMAVHFFGIAPPSINTGNRMLFRSRHLEIRVAGFPSLTPHPPDSMVLTPKEVVGAIIHH